MQRGSNGTRFTDGKEDLGLVLGFSNGYATNKSQTGTRVCQPEYGHIHSVLGLSTLAIILSFP